MRLILLLADAAQADPSGKVNALGLGWNAIGAATVPFSVVLLMDVEWVETNRPYHVKVQLLTQDGQPVLVEGGDGARVPVVLEARAEVGRPPGLAPGSMLRMPVVFTIGTGVPIPQGRYVWRASIEGHPDWTADEPFDVRGV